MMMALTFIAFIVFFFICDFLVEMTINTFIRGGDENTEEQIEEIREMRKKRYERFTK
jgi:hypothetical protein